jgi:hypothetical protein
MRFTALLHHVSLDRLRMAFSALKKDAAPGTDGGRGSSTRSTWRRTTSRTCTGDCTREPRRDLLEVIEDRYDRSSTVITTQMPTKTWHEALVDPTIADAICDRLVHNAHVLKLVGPSIRRSKALQSEKPATPNPS